MTDYNNIVDVDLCGIGTPWWTCLNDIVRECTSIKTGEFNSLIINQGGIQNRISQKAKVKFKNEVMPFLMTIACMDTQLTGSIKGQLAEGTLRSATLSFQCKEGHTITPIF